MMETMNMVLKEDGTKELPFCLSGGLSFILKQFLNKDLKDKFLPVRWNAAYGTLCLLNKELFQKTLELEKQREENSE